MQYTIKYIRSIASVHPGSLSKYVSRIFSYEENIIEYKRNFSWESFVSGIEEVCRALDERR